MIRAIMQFRQPHSTVEAGLIVSAVAALLLGSAVYLLGRDWSDTMLLAPFIDYQWATSAVFGNLGGFLPAFLHAYAIPVLIIVALRPWPWTRPWVCLLWFTIASTFEWLQSDTAEALFFSATQPSGLSLLTYVKSYARHGQFDYLDLMVSAMGCLCALAATVEITPPGRQV